MKLIAVMLFELKAYTIALLHGVAHWQMSISLFSYRWEYTARLINF